MKILLIQLATATFEPADLRSNVPLAAGNLAAMTRLRLASRGVEVEVLSRDYCDRAGDEAVAREILRRGPDLIGATLYCWSSYRTLDVLSRVRAAQPGVRVVVGGPEVDGGNEFLMSFAGRAFDFAVSGEGEEILLDLIESILDHKSFDTVSGLGTANPLGVVWTPPRAPVRDLSTLPSPYLSGDVELRESGIAHLETARGCAFECDFCFYHADFRQVRAFPRDRVAREIEQLLDAGISDLYLMDPTFNGHSGYRETLRTLKPKLDHRDASVHTELIAEPMNAKNVGELVESGITSVEVGLQTVTPEALKAVGRHFDRTKFARGCRELLNAGIRVEIGTIVGLPSDTPEGMRRTFEYALQECGAEAETVPFVLSLLPATVLRSRAAQFGIEYRYFPPYQITKSPTFSDGGIRSTLESFTEVFEQDLDTIGTIRLVESGEPQNDVSEAPHLLPNDLVRRVVFTPATSSRENCLSAGAEFARHVELTFGIIAKNVRTPEDVTRVAAFATQIRERNRHGLLEIALEVTAQFDVSQAVRALRAALPPIDGHYLNEHLRYISPEGADLSMRVICVIPVLAKSTWGAKIAEQLPVLWKCNIEKVDGSAVRYESALESGALLINAPKALDIGELAREFGEDARDLRFQDSSQQRLLDVALSHHAHPPETVVLLGEGAQIVAVRRDL